MELGNCEDEKDNCETDKKQLEQEKEDLKKEKEDIEYKYKKFKNCVEDLAISDDYNELKSIYYECF